MNQEAPKLECGLLEKCKARVTRTLPGKRANQCPPDSQPEDPNLTTLTRQFRLVPPQALLQLSDVT